MVFPISIVVRLLFILFLFFVNNLVYIFNRYVDAPAHGNNVIDFNISRYKYVLKLEMDKLLAPE